MAESERKHDEEEEEEEKLMEGVVMLDFDMLCSTVAMRTQGKYIKLVDEQVEDAEYAGEFEGVLRMWEGDLLDCFQDRRIAIQTVCCPCYRFGKNMRRAGFGSCFIQGIAYSILAVTALLNIIAFVVTKRQCFLYVGVAFTFSLVTYLGFYRTQIRKKFNIKGSDSSLDDCVYHMICPCCTLCQESRTLEMNNVHDSTWHGRGDTICIGEGSKTLFEVNPTPSMSTMSPEPPCIMQRGTNDNNGHS